MTNALSNLALSNADQLALLLWKSHREQKVRFERIGSTDTDKGQAAWDLLMDLEHVLHSNVRASVHALAASLIIEIEDNESGEDVPGLWRGSLSAIRPQLVGAIAEAADRVLAENDAA